MFNNYWVHRHGVAIYKKWWQRQYRARWSNLVVKGNTPIKALSNLDRSLEEVLKKSMVGVGTILGDRVLLPC